MKTKSLAKLLSYYIALQVIILTVCLFIPKLFGVPFFKIDFLGSSFFIYPFLIGFLFYAFSIGVNAVFSILLLFYFSKRSVILLIISSFISIIYNPHIQLNFYDDQITKLYDFAVDQELICKDYNQVIRIMGKPYETTILEGSKIFYYYPESFFWVWASSRLSITIKNDTVVHISVKNWMEIKAKSMQKMREQQKACNKLQIKD